MVRFPSSILPFLYSLGYSVCALVIFLDRVPYIDRFGPSSFGVKVRYARDEEE
ncbi:hypothetical protein AA0116_g9551 [Alternaria tenuissima]|nr:hypothetical protein AA0116_g9551 [Alternaria tenuissima]